MKKEGNAQNREVEDFSTHEPVHVADGATATPPVAKTGNETAENSRPAEDAPGAEAAAPEGEGTPADPQGAAADSQPAASDPGPTVEELIEQAYLRGRNEAIEALMRQPGMMQPLQGHATPKVGNDADVMILNRPHTSIWER